MPENQEKMKINLLFGGEKGQQFEGLSIENNEIKTAVSLALAIDGNGVATVKKIGFEPEILPLSKLEPDVARLVTDLNHKMVQLRRLSSDADNLADKAKELRTIVSTETTLISVLLEKQFPAYATQGDLSLKSNGEQIQLTVDGFPVKEAVVDQEFARPLYKRLREKVELEEAMLVAEETHTSTLNRLRLAKGEADMANAKLKEGTRYIYESGGVASIATTDEGLVIVRHVDEVLPEMPMNMRRQVILEHLLGTRTLSDSIIEQFGLRQLIETINALLPPNLD